MADADSMIERVKAALVANLHEQGYTTAIDANGYCLIDTTVDMNLFVRAVIAAMREPTEAMLDAPRRAHVSAADYTMHAGEADAAWRAMIDKALK